MGQEATAAFFFFYSSILVWRIHPPGVREKIDGKPVAVVKITPEEVRNASRIIEKNEKNEKNKK